MADKQQRCEILFQRTGSVYVASALEMITDPMIISVDQIFSAENLDQAYGQASDLGSFHHFRHRLGLENSTGLRLLYFDLLLHEQFPHLGNQLSKNLHDIQFEKNISLEEFIQAFRQSQSNRGFVLQIPSKSLQKKRRVDLTFQSYYIIPRREVQTIFIRPLEETVKEESQTEQSLPLF